jgi:hypothetical protein
VAPPLSLNFFEGTKKRHVSFNNFEKQVDRDLKGFDRETLLENLARAKADKIMRYAALHLNGPRKSPVLSVPNMMVNPFIELERQKFRPSPNAKKMELPELTEHYKELD